VVFDTDFLSGRVTNIRGRKEKKKRHLWGIIMDAPCIFPSQLPMDFDGYPMASQPSHLGDLGPPARSRHDLTWGRSWDMADMGKGKQNMGCHQENPRKSKRKCKKIQENKSRNGWNQA